MFPTVSAAETGKYAPLHAALWGAAGGLVFWLAMQLWPASVAVILAMAATAPPRMRQVRSVSEVLPAVFYVLIKYSALMALSAATLPFAAPPNVALGLIMLCASAASAALGVSAQPRPATPQLGGAGLPTALILGFAPAVLLGVPGLIGLAAAIAAALTAMGYLRANPASAAAGPVLNAVAPVAELCFYLGALAARSYV